MSFTRNPALPDGFVLLPDFVGNDEERAVLDFIRTVAFGSVRMHGVTARRRVAQFGWHYSFESFRLAPAPALPPVLEGLRERAAALAQIEPARFEEALITDYPPGPASAGTGMLRLSESWPAYRWARRAACGSREGKARSARPPRWNCPLARSTC